MRSVEIARRRAEIDALDARLLLLVNRRAQIAQELGPLKRQAGLPLCDQKREALILARLLASNSGPLENHSVLRIFRSESRRLQHKEEDLNSAISAKENQGVRGHDHQHA